MIDLANKLLPANDVLDQAASPAAFGHMAEKFGRLMEPGAPGGARETIVGAESPVTHFVQAHEAVMRNTFADVRAFSSEAPNMNIQDLAAAQISLTYQVAEAHLQFHAGVHVAQSTKNGLQTLMKNQ